MFRWLSKESFFAFFLTYGCPFCGYGSLVVWKQPFRFYKPDASEYLFASSLPSIVSSGLYLPLFMDRSAFVECRKCGKRWSVFRASALPDITFSFIETERTDEPLGDDTRLIDNSHSSVELTRKFVVGKEWTQSYTFDRETFERYRTELKIGGSDLPALTATAENALKQRYSITSEAKQSHTEEIAVTVPARTRFTMVFHWKRVWQHGLLQAFQADRKVAESAFKLAVGITFDQTQSDHEKL